MSQLTSTTINYCCDICLEDREFIVKKITSDILAELDVFVFFPQFKKIIIFFCSASVSGKSR